MKREVWITPPSAENDDPGRAVRSTPEPSPARQSERSQGGRPPAAPSRHASPIDLAAIGETSSIARPLRFPLGIPGFEDAKSFVLVEHAPGSPFFWLRSVDVPEVAFVVIQIVSFVADYPIDNVRRALSFCELEADEDLVVLAICNIPAEPEPPTANFQAPIGIGLRSRRGAQVLLHETEFDMRCAFL